MNLSQKIILSIESKYLIHQRPRENWWFRNRSILSRSENCLEIHNYPRSLLRWTKKVLMTKSHRWMVSPQRDRGWLRKTLKTLSTTGSISRTACSSTTFERNSPPTSKSAPTSRKRHKDIPRRTNQLTMNSAGSKKTILTSTFRRRKTAKSWKRTIHCGNSRCRASKSRTWSPWKTASGPASWSAYRRRTCRSSCSRPRTTDPTAAVSPPSKVRSPRFLSTSKFYRSHIPNKV